MATLEVDLSPDLRARIEAAASRQGLAVSDYARTALEKVLEEEAVSAPRRNIMELHGLGADIWRNNTGSLIDAQKYVDGLRQEWD